MMTAQELLDMVKEFRAQQQHVAQIDRYYGERERKIKLYEGAGRLCYCDVCVKEHAEVYPLEEIREVGACGGEEEGKRVRVKAQESKGEQEHCAVCRDGPDGLVVCRGCGTMLHAQCLVSLPGCPTLGCGERDPLLGVESTKSEDENYDPKELRRILKYCRRWLVGLLVLGLPVIHLFDSLLGNEAAFTASIVIVGAAGALAMAIGMGHKDQQAARVQFGMCRRHGKKGYCASCHSSLYW